MSELTIASLLRTATLAMRDVSDSPLLDAEVLLQHVANLTRSQLRSDPEKLPQKDQVERFNSLVERRLRGEPIAYLLGTREFWSLRFEVDPRVLIPRPETELVVERALLHTPKQGIARILDLGTGSGAIALAIAYERPAYKIHATDISRDALAVAQRNAETHGLRNVFFRCSGWYSMLADERYDIIVSNPPYIAADDRDLNNAVLQYEPTDALIAGDTGMEAIAEIIRGAPVHLVEHGWIILEHGWKQAAHVRALLVQAGFGSVASHADLAGIERVSEGQWRS